MSNSQVCGQDKTWSSSQVFQVANKNEIRIHNGENARYIYNMVESPHDNVDSVHGGYADSFVFSNPFFHQGLLRLGTDSIASRLQGAPGGSGGYDPNQHQDGGVHLAATFNASEVPYFCNQNVYKSIQSNLEKARAYKKGQNQ